MIAPVAVGIGVLLVVGGFLYWQLVIAEGVYLGQGLVTYLYDITARRYDDIKAYQPAMEDLFLGQPLAEMLGDRPGSAVLDIGTGTGRLPLSLFGQEAFTGEVVGVDASLPMLAKAQTKLVGFTGRHLLIWKNADRLPFPNDLFDAVTCLEMSEFTADPVAQLREGIRVLKPGGILLTSRRRGTDARLMPGKTFPAAEFQDILRRLGLHDVRIDPWQVDYDLVWAQKSGVLVGQPVAMREQILCQSCGQQTLNWQPAKVVCNNCRHEYKSENGILLMEQRKIRLR